MLLIVHVSTLGKGQWVHVSIQCLLFTVTPTMSAEQRVPKPLVTNTGVSSTHVCMTDVHTCYSELKSSFVWPLCAINLTLDMLFT